MLRLKCETKFKLFNLHSNQNFFSLVQLPPNPVKLKDLERGTAKNLDFETVNKYARKLKMYLEKAKGVKRQV